LPDGEGFFIALPLYPVPRRGKSNIAGLEPKATAVHSCLNQAYRQDENNGAEGDNQAEQAACLHLVGH
jgi:hypothetical protein